MILTFSVLGKPQPQGSARLVPTPGGPRITSDNPKLHGWRKQLGWDAKAAQRSEPLGFYAQEGSEARANKSNTSDTFALRHRRGDGDTRCKQFTQADADGDVGDD